MKKQRTLIIILSTIAIIAITAIHSSMAQQVFVAEKTYKSFDKVTLEGSVDMSRIRLSPKQSVIVTPFITDHRGHEKLLDPIVIAGKNKARSMKREATLSRRQPIEQNNYYVWDSKNQLREHYISTTVFEEWMRGGSVGLKIVSIKCNRSTGSGNTKAVVARGVLKAYTPSYILDMIAVDDKGEKQREHVVELRPTYARGSAVLSRNFADNKRELQKLDDAMQEILSDKNLQILSLSVAGYASPEGSSSHNLQLSKRRAEALTAYINRQYKNMPRQAVMHWAGEDWEGLRKLIQASDVPSKSEVLQIINTQTCDENKLQEIKALNGGQTYEYILSKLFPTLRRNECRIVYSVKPFDANQAQEVFSESPEQLSLSEIYQIAESYGKGSSEYRDLVEQAAELFPNDVNALVNAAIVKIERGDAQGAVTLLEPLSNDSRVWNTLGVAYAHSGQILKARQTLAKGKAAGDSNCAANSGELERQIKE